MVVLNRVAYLRKLLLHGAKFVCTSATNAETLNEKIRIHVYPEVRVECRYQTSASSMLDYIMAVCGSLHVADRGHRCSDGHSEVSFIISHGKLSKSKATNSDADAEPFVHGPPADTLVGEGAAIFVHEVAITGSELAMNTALPSPAVVSTAKDQPVHAIDIARLAEIEILRAACDVKAAVAADSPQVPEADAGDVSAKDKRDDVRDDSFEDDLEEKDEGNQPKRARFLVEM